MDPVTATIGLAIAGGATLVQTGIGLFKSRRAEKEYKKALKDRPTFHFSLPETYDRAVQEAYKGLTGMDLTPFMLQAAGITSRQADLINRYAVTSTQAISGVGQAYASEMDMLQQLALDEMKRREAARGMYINTLIQKGGAEMLGKLQEFEYNQWLPWQMKLNYLSGKYAAGQNMMASGLQSFANIAGSYFEAQYQANALANITK